MRRLSDLACAETWFGVMATKRRRVAGSYVPPNISCSRPPELAGAQVTGSRPAAAEHHR